MTTVNEAKFTIEGTPSEDASGNRGYDASNGQTLDVTLEVDPSPVLAVTYSVYDSADSSSPLASKNAPAIEWNENSQKSISPSNVNGTVTIDLPATGSHSYVIRCMVVTPRGAVYFERLVTIRTPGTANARKTAPAEGAAYSPRGESDAQNELVDAFASSLAYYTGSYISGSPTASQKVHLHSFSAEVVFPAALAGSKGRALVAATAQTDFDIQKSGVSIGTMRFAAAGTLATFIAASETTFDPTSDDYLTVVAPGTPDATLADVAFTLAGSRVIA